MPESECFDGDRLITRGQLAAIFHRYGQQVALLSSPEDVPDLASAPDYADVASWAADGLKGRLSVGVLSGKPGGLLDPNGTAVRAELAQMLFKLSQVDPLFRRQAGPSAGRRRYSTAGLSPGTSLWMRRTPPAA